MFGAGLAFDLDQIGFRPFEFRRGDLRDARAVVRQQQQAFGIHVQAAGRINILGQFEARQGRPGRHALVGELRQHAIRLIESD